jgi:transaldolase
MTIKRWIVNPLKQLETLGQSVWLDFIKRDLIRSGELSRLIAQDCLRGMTSNPVLFEKAIDESQEYNEAISKMAKQNKPVNQIYEALTIKDVQEAADAFRDVYQKTEGKDGYVSLEVNPHLAYDTQATISEARRLWHELNRPNVLIKVPATKEGLPAITQLLSDGINVNVTILFGLPRYKEVAQAYISGLEARAAQGKPLNHIASVASFFLSRIDVLVDPMLEKIMQEKSDQSIIAKKMYGQVAIASAKIANQDHAQIFDSEQFKRLQQKGAQPQRLLWASTGTKNPKYSKIKYVEALIGPNTINTLPFETFKEYRQNGQPEVRLTKQLDEAHWLFLSLPSLGIDINRVTEQLEREGVDKFNVAYDGLIRTLENKMAKVKKAA